MTARRPGLRRPLHPSGLVSPSAGPPADPPVWTDPPAPDPLSEPWAGGTIAWTDGTVTGADSVTYDVRVDGVGQGVAAGSWVVPAGIVGSSVLRRGSATNGEGTTTEDSTALTIVDLVPLRAGSTERYLRDTTGQLVDSGSPDYAYDGTGGGELLRIDPVGTDGAIVAGDTVGVCYPWDSVTGTGVGAAFIATLPPYTVRGTDGTGAGFLGTRYLTLTPALGATRGTVVGYVNRITTSTQYLCSRNNNEGMQLGFTNAAVQCRLVTSAPAVAANADIAAALPVGVNCVIVLEFDRATPGGGTGTLKSAAYRLDTGALVGTNSATYTVSALNENASVYVGRGVSSGDYYRNTKLIYQEFAGARLITDGAIADIVDGSDPTAGGALTRSIGGIRSGVYDPDDVTRIIYSAGAGDPVLAGGSI